MKTLTAVLLVAASFQDDGLERVTIGKQQRSLYQGALNAARDAATLIDSDPAAALTRIAPVLANKDIAHREVRLRLEDNFGGYGEWTVFLPYQVRGLASLAQARKLSATARTEAAALAKQAVDDLKFSVERKAVSSSTGLADAEKLLESLREKPVPEDPRVVAARKVIEELRALVDGGAKAEDILRRCEETVEAVKGTPSELEHDLLRKEAERRRDERERRRQDGLMAELREWLKSSPDPGEVVRRCDALAPGIADASLARELKTIREGAVGDRVEALRRKVFAACEAGRFKSAGKILTDHGGFLETKQQVALELEIQERASRRVQADLDRARRWFRNTLTAESGWVAVRNVPADELAVTFQFPDPAELFGEVPEMTWALEIHPVLAACPSTPEDKIQERVADLLGAAVRAVRFFRDGRVEWFLGAVHLAFDGGKRRIQALIAASVDAEAAVRDSRVAEAGRIIGLFRDRHGEARKAAAGLGGDPSLPAELDAPGTMASRLQELFLGFPQQPAGLAEIWEQLRDPKNPGGMYGESPVAAIEAAERRWKAVLEEPGRVLAIEARHEIRARLFGAAVYRSLLSGQPVEALGRREDFRDLRRALTGDPAGTKSKLAEFGPKVVAVYERLER